MKRHRGRPRKLEAKRRATTRAGRARETDLGTDEVRRLRRVLNGREDLAADPLSALFARDLIDKHQYDAARRYAALTEIMRHGWGLQEGSVADLYRRMIAGNAADIIVRNASHASGEVLSSADVAKTTLIRINAALWPPGDDGRAFYAVQAIAIDQLWPAWLQRVVLRATGPRDQAALAILVEGVGRLVEARRPQSVGPGGGGQTGQRSVRL